MATTASLTVSPIQPSINVEWKVENLRELKDFLPLYSAKFDRGHWRLRIMKAYDNYIFALEPQRMNPEGLEGSVASEGVSEIKYSFSVQVCNAKGYLVKTRDVVVEIEIGRGSLDGESEAPCLGIEVFRIAEAKIEHEAIVTVKVAVRLPSTPSASTHGIGRIAFNNPTCSDVVVRVRNDVKHPFRDIFVNKDILSSRSSYFKTILASGFSETQRYAEIDVSTSMGKSRVVVEDEDDMSPFDTFDSTETDPITPSDGDDEGDKARGPKRRKITASPRESSSTNPVDTRSVLCVNVEDTPIAAYTALLAFLYTDSITFLPLPSEWLVARQAKRATRQDESGRFTFPSRLQWLLDHPPPRQISALPLLEGVGPCSAHAVYRLAHRYSMSELCAHSRQYIVDNLTVENVSYELFSPLSIDFEAVQQDILEYFNDNWDMVRKTASFKVVLDNILKGKLSNARSISEKVFERVRTG